MTGGWEQVPLQQSPSQGIDIYIHMNIVILPVSNFTPQYSIAFEYITLNVNKVEGLTFVTD